MKKLLLIATLAFAAVSMNAQGLEGKWFAGGQLGYKHTKLGDAKSDQYTILPTIGTFISPDVAVGASLGYEGSKAGSAKNNTIVIAPLARKYWNISGGLYFFGQASLPVTIGNIKGVSSVEIDGQEFPATGKVKTLGVNVQLAPGFDYIINDKFSIETSFNILSLGYNRTKMGETKADSFGFFANEGQKFGELKIGFKMIF